MRILVQKFGGTSVADIDRLKMVRGKVKAALDQGYKVVVVLSAKSGKTNKLLDLSTRWAAEPDLAEVDSLLSTGEQASIALFSMLLKDSGIKARSMLGWQIPIITNDEFGRARILSIDASRIHKELEAHDVLVVAGFQGSTEDGRITTLGRGGSDTSAVALAAALHADLCQIYTDVDGVYTADPRKIPAARKLDVISYDEMLELATLGAQVLNNRSVEMAKKYHIELEVLSSLTRAKGTIVKEATNVEKMLISGVAKDENVARISVIGVPDKPGLAFRIFSKLAQKNVNVDIILQSIGRNGTKDISFTVEKDKMDATIELMQSYVETIGASSVVFDDDVAKVSIVGAGMESHPGVASDMFEALFEANVNIQMISTSEIKISVLIKKEDANKAVAAIHAKFFKQIGQ